MSDEESDKLAPFTEDDDEGSHMPSADMGTFDPSDSGGAGLNDSLSSLLTSQVATLTCDNFGEMSPLPADREEMLHRWRKTKVVVSASSELRKGARPRYGTCASVCLMCVYVSMYQIVAN
jgi:hypothetical protein